MCSRFSASGRLALLAAVLTLTGSALSQTQPPWADAFQTAVSQLQSGDTAAAMKTFDSLWKNNSTNPQLASGIGASLDATSHHKEATAWYQKALAIRPDYEPALNNLALNYATLGEFAKARPLLRSVLRLNPANSHAAYNLGLIELRLHNYKDAADAFETSRKTGGSAVAGDQVVLAEATARFHLKEYARCAVLLEGVQANRNRGYFLLLGSAEALSGDLPSAVKTLQSGVTAAPDDPQTYYRLALVFMLGRLDHEAQNVLSEGLKQIPQSPLLLFGRAVSSEMQGKLDDAIASVKQSLSANPRQPAAWELLGKLYSETDRLPDALAAYGQAMNLKADADFGVARVQLLIRMQRFSDAEAELRQLEKQFPNNGSVDRGFGKLYREERKFDLAEKYLRHTILLNPDDADAHFALAEVLRLTQRTDEARKEFEIFKQKKPVPEATRLLQLAAGSTGDAGDK